ncbi:MAG: AbiH family protein, partial [Bacteroidota bacterium]
LKSLNISKHDFQDGNFPRIFSEKIKEADSPDLEKDMKPESIYFLSFNYTPTILKYRTLTKSYNDKLRYNFIHGELDNPRNPIVFGFGDEFDNDFKEFEALDNNELFRHIKSFKYSQTPNYHNLLRFIEADRFQVYVMGHSCGISDRTMLREIFEHDNCTSIKIFYHEISKDSNDFLEKVYDISRHFTDNGVMRRKLVPFENSRPMPQPRV